MNCACIGIRADTLLIEHYYLLDSNDGLCPTRQLIEKNNIKIPFEAYNIVSFIDSSFHPNFVMRLFVTFLSSLFI